MVNQLTGKRRRKALNDIVPINTAASTAVFGDSAPELRGMKLAAVRPRQKSTAGLRGIAAAKPNTAEAAQAAGIFRPRKGTAGLIHLSGADTGNHPNGANSPNSVGINAVGGNAVGNSDNSSGSNEGNENSGTGSSSDSFEDYYTRLLETLHGYGVALTLPTLEELYSQLEQFLRPAVDSAIDNRREHGETTLAELDADAYSRGMGGSTYLSGMKRREYDAVAADIAMLLRPILQCLRPIIMLSLQNIFMKQRRSLRAFSRVLPKCSFGTGRTCKSSAHNRQEEVPETEKAADKAETGKERARAAAPAAEVIPKEAESTITIIVHIFPIFPRRISIMFSSAILPNGRQ